MSRFERWSRRKLGQENDEPVEAAPTDETPQGDEAESPIVDASPAAAAEAEPAPGSLDATLPDPDSLPAGADFSAYLAKGVSRQLRRRALRRLWSTGGYGVRDGLDDYDENYREVLKPLARDLADQLRRWTRPEPAAEEGDVQQTRPSPAPEAEQPEAEADAPQDSAEAISSEDDEALACRSRDQGGIGQGSRGVKE